MCMGGAPSTAAPLPPPPPTRLAELQGGQKAPGKVQSKKRSLRTVKKKSAPGAGLGGLSTVTPSAGSPTLGA